MGIIKAFKLGFDYLKYDEDGNVEATQRAVNDVNLDIEAGRSGAQWFRKIHIGEADKCIAYPFRGNHVGG
jgi:hypothetical protein